MGCDIHFYVEHFADNKWNNIAFNSDAADGHWFPWRNYYLFSILAGVRGDIEPMMLPRGIPADISSAVVKEWKRWQGDGHTPSYYTVAEILEAKNNKVQMSGAVDVTGYKLFKSTGVPDKWTKYTRDNEVIVSNKEMERLVDLAVFLDDKHYVTDIDWYETYDNLSPDFWKDTVNLMSKLDPDPTLVRCVFWFDN